LRHEVGGLAAQRPGGVKLAAWRAKISVLQKCYLNNKTAFNEVLNPFPHEHIVKNGHFH
jgi:hypothetical protein